VPRSMPDYAALAAAGAADARRILAGIED
jgi:hypothetical protein